jgi:hypothetical protein
MEEVQRRGGCDREEREEDVCMCGMVSELICDNGVITIIMCGEIHNVMCVMCMTVICLLICVCVCVERRNVEELSCVICVERTLLIMRREEREREEERMVCM